MSEKSEEKLDRIISDLDDIKRDNELIKKALKIVPDRDATVTDFETSIRGYEEFALEAHYLGEATVNNQKSAIRGFLNHSNGIINLETVKSYLDSNEQKSWKSNQVKALRKYIRDFLKLGNWINEFGFTKDKAKIKKIPRDDQLALFCNYLNYQIQIVFLVTMTTGFRIGEVLALKLSNIDFVTNMIDASQIHKSDTKDSWISYVTNQTAEYLQSYIESNEFDQYGDDPKLFSVSYKVVNENFKKVSNLTGISIIPHLLRTVFTEKCTQARIEDKYIDAFCGRISQNIIRKHYTDYSPKAMRRHYDKVEQLLTLPFTEDDD